MFASAKIPLVCLGLATFALSVNSCQSEQPAAEQRITDDIALLNLDLAKVDLACLRRKAAEFGQLVDSGGLDPYRVRVFGDHNLVKQVLTNPCVQIAHSGTIYFVTLEGKAHVVSRVEAGDSFNYGYWAVKGDKFSFADCISKAE